MARAKQYWLFKSDPESFSITDLVASPEQTTCWDGVRNYQVRNMMRDDMAPGDLLLFYHSNNSPGVYGTAKIVSQAYADHTAWEPGNHHFDAKASPENPIWQMVDIQLDKVFKHPVTLDQLRNDERFAEMLILRRGNRLSITPVSKDEYQAIVKLGK